MVCKGQLQHMCTKRSHIRRTTLIWDKIWLSSQVLILKLVIMARLQTISSDDVHMYVMCALSFLSHQFQHLRRNPSVSSKCTCIQIMLLNLLNFHNVLSTLFTIDTKIDQISICNVSLPITKLEFGFQSSHACPWHHMTFNVS